MRLRALGAAAALISCARQAPLAPLPSLGPTAPMPRVSVSPAPVSSASTPTIAPKTSLAATPAAPPPALPAVSLGDIGGSGPVFPLVTSPSGAWVALCDGEPKTAKLVLGSGAGAPIDEVYAADASGRYVVTAKDGVAELVDAALGTRVNLSELGADVRRVRDDYAEHRTLSFDAQGRFLAYLRRQGTAPQIVVRTLESGSEQTFSPGAGDVFRLKLSPDARYVTFDALRDDTNKNGKLDFPAPDEPDRKNVCEKPALPRFRSFGYQGRGDAVTRAVVSLADGVVRDVPDLVTPLGASLLVREADASLRLDQQGKRTLLAPAACAGRVLFADAERGLVLVACAPPPPKNPHKVVAPSGKREVWLFGAGLAKNLGSELYETSIDRDEVVGTRLVAVYPGSDASLLDLARHEVLPLTTGSRVVTTSGALALIWRENDLYRYDAEHKAEQLLAHGVLKNPDLLQSGSTVLLSPYVVVAADAPALWGPPRALAVSSGGFVLVPSAPPATTAAGPARSSIEGPLHWVDARLPPPDGPPR